MINLTRICKDYKIMMRHLFNSCLLPQSVLYAMQLEGEGKEKKTHTQNHLATLPLM